MYLCSINTKKIKLNVESWDKVKPNSFEIPLEKEVTRKGLN
jgi:hypothetical protein